MKLIFSLLLLLFVVVFTDTVRYLKNTTDLQSLQKKQPNHIILFMKEHELCSKINSTYRQLSSKLQSKHSLHFHIVMYEDSLQMFTQLNIQSVPQIILIINHQKVGSHYNGLYEHTQQEFEQWIDKNFDKNLPIINEIFQSKRTLIIDIGCKHQKQLLNLRIKDNHNLYYCSNQALNQYSIGQIILVTPHNTFVYNSSINLKTWIQTYQDGYLKPLTDYYIYQIFNTNMSYFVLLTHLDQNSQAVLPYYKQFARKHTNQTIGFIYSNIDDNLQLQVEFLHFVGFIEDFPYPHISFLTIEFDQLVKFHPGKITKQNITSWMQSVLKDQEQDFTKNIDYEQKDEPSVFSSIGLNSLINISSSEEAQLFIYFYSQYCQQCVLRLGDLKHDLKISKSLAKHYYRYSITENDVPFFADVESVPTLVYIKGKYIIKYLDDQHTVQNMVQFVQKNNQNVQVVAKRIRQANGQFSQQKDDSIENSTNHNHEL